MKSRTIRKHVPSIIAVAVVAFLGILVLFSLKSMGDEVDKMTALESNVSRLQLRSGILKNNQILAKHNIEEYNKMLAQLVPDHEDFFSIIYALEAISIKTNLNINEYTVNLNMSSKDKVSITIKGDGDSESFMDFLKNYNFGGGRLITSSKLEFSPESTGKIKLSLNFYNKPVPKKIEQSQSISQKDIQLMDEVKGKIFVSFKSPEDLGTDYATKKDPFSPLK